MTLVKYKTGNSVYDIFNNIDSIFNNYFQLDNNYSNISNRWSPSFDIKEYDKSFNIIADMPGVNKNDVSINIDEDMLIIEGSRRLKSDKQDKWYCREIQYGDFKRSFYLPENINKDKITASLDNGVLQIEIHKIKPIKTKLKKINIT